MSKSVLPGSFIEPVKRVVLCPECHGDDIQLTWVDAEVNSVGIDTELGDCQECGHEWNECARKRYE